MSPQLEHPFISFLSLTVFLGVSGVITFVQQIVDAIIESSVRFSRWLGYRFDGFGGASFRFRVLGFEDARADVIPDALGRSQPCSQREHTACNHRNERTLHNCMEFHLLPPDKLKTEKIIPEFRLGTILSASRGVFAVMQQQRNDYDRRKIMPKKSKKQVWTVLEPTWDAPAESRSLKPSCFPKTNRDAL